MNTHILYYGSVQDPVEAKVLNAGPVTLVYANGFIRQISLGNEEVVNMIYYALRDDHWGTYHGTIKNEKIRSTAKGFEVSYRSVVSEGPIQYVFDCVIKGNAEGKIEFSLRGESYSKFKSNRIGFCVLHSTRSYAGKPVKITRTDKSETEGLFPVLAEPYQPFINIKSMSWEPIKGWEADIKFDGDIFEMEDQRNWSDGSYKTYCTPLTNPMPVEIKMGDTIRQKVTLSVNALRKSAASKLKKDEEITLTALRGEVMGKLPAIGLGDTTFYREYSPGDLDLLKPLSLDHIRSELNTDSPRLREEIESIKKRSSSLGVPVLAALNFGTDPVSEVKSFVGISREVSLDIQAFAIFDKKAPSTPADLIRNTASLLKEAYPDALIGGGSNQYFAELNRNRVEESRMDFLVFPSTPQAHLIHREVMLDNLHGVPGALKTALHFSKGKPVYVSPITLRYPASSQPGKPGGSMMDHLPSDVDPLQASLFAAGWTLASIKYLAEAGAGQLTYYETAGWKGVIQGNQASPVPAQFNAQSGWAFPVYFVFYWLGKLAGAGLIPLQSSAPVKVNGLGLLEDQNKYYLLANHTSLPVTFSFHQAKKGTILSKLNEKNAASFMKDPLAVLNKNLEEPVEASLTMMPYEILVIKV